MRKNLFKIALLGVLGVITSCGTPQNTSEDRVIIQENTQTTSQTTTPTSYSKAKPSSVSLSDVKSSLEYLASNELRGRETGTDGIEKAAAYIENVFKTNNIKPYYTSYRDSFDIQNRKGYNIIGLVEGNDSKLKDEYIIIGAHYDHIGLGKVVNGDSIANGANDNAAGTVAVMELAKYFAETKDNKRSLLFILFSAEEMGLQGSKHHAKRIKQEGMDVYAMVNFEMIGVPMVGKDYLAYVTGMEKSNLAERFNAYSNENILGFLPQAEEYNLFMRSDNYPYFQELNIPAQTICTFDFTNYDYYHHVSDEASKMNFQHMVNVIESVIPGLHGMANTMEKEIKLN